MSSTRWGLTLPGLSLVLLFPCCTGPTAPPFRADNTEGKYYYMKGGGISGGMNLTVNNRPVLQDARMFRDRERLICINTIDDLDVIVAFGGQNGNSSMSISLVNATDRNLALHRLTVLSFTPDHGARMDKTGEGSLEIRAGGAGPLQIIPPAGNTWDFSWSLDGDTVSLGLRMGIAPVVLLPDEKLEFPPVRFQ